MSASISLLRILLLCSIVVVANGDNKLTNYKPLWNATVIDKLRNSLLLTYDKFARPAHHTNSTRVLIDFTIRHVDLDEVKGTMTVNGWMRLNWRDEKLKWNRSDFEGMSTLHVANHEIWQPDIVLYNSGAGSSLDYYGNTYCIVHSDGLVYWIPPFEFVVFCELNMLLWPFDTQMCQLQFGSWTYDGAEVDLQYAENIQNNLIVQNSEWEIKDVISVPSEEYLSIYDEPRLTVTVQITVERRSPTYKTMIIAPAFTIIVMTLLNFWLPPEAGEKIVLNVSTAIIICIFMLNFAQKCSIKGNHTPMIVLFYSSSLYVASCSLITSVSVIWLSRTQHYRPLPWLLKQRVTGRFGRWLALATYIKQTSISNTRLSVVEELRDQQSMFDDQTSSDEHQIITPLEVPEPSQADWILLAAAIDRISFLFYSLLFVILATVYAV